VLIKDAEALEVMEKVDMLVVDKTGTLTEGKPRSCLDPGDAGYDEASLLRLAASLERAVKHPLAAAIVAGAGERNVTLLPRRTSSHSQPRNQGTVDGKCRAGNRTCSNELHMTPASCGEGERLRADAKR